MPGVGKTVLARALARAAGCEFSRLQCTADLLPADVTGTNIWDQREAEFRFRPGPVFANLILVDEVNRASPKTQSALLECMEEHQVTVDGTTHPLPAPFMVIATQNPIEHEGTFPLPEAQLDRFALRLSMGYPAPAVEAQMLCDLADKDPIAEVPVVASPAEIEAASREVARVHVAAGLAEYVVGVLSATRADPRCALGASPRSGLGLIRAAKAIALIEGRDYVVPDDIKRIAVMALAHRIVLGTEAQIRSTDAVDVVADALEATRVP